MPVDAADSVEESAIGWFDFAIATICAWLVPRLISRQRLYHRTLRRSPMWINEKVRMGSQIDEKPKEYAENAITRSMVNAIGISVFVYTVTAIVLSTLTRDLDNRTSYIVVGLSNFVGAFFVFLLSFSAPRWLGVYTSIYSEGRRIPLGANLTTLCLKVRLQVFYTFLRVYPLMIPFFLGARPSTIPASVFIGILFGFFLCLTIDFGNREVTDRNNLRKFAICIAFCFILASAYLFSYGCSYVEEVWGDQDIGDENSLVEGVAFLCWTVAGVLLHVVVWQYCKRHKAAGHQVHKRPRTFFGSSVFISHRHLDNHDSRGKATLTSLRSVLSGRNLFHKKPASNSNGLTDTGGLHTHPLTIKEDDEDPSRLTAIKEDPSSKPELASSAALESGEIESSSKTKDEQEVAPDTAGIEVADNRDGDVNMLKVAEEENENEDGADEYEQHRGPGMLQSPIDSSEPPTKEAQLGAHSLHDIFEKSACSTRHVDGEGDDGCNDAEDPDDEDWDTSRLHVCNVVCCDLNCGAAGREKPCSERAINCCRWTAWVFLFAASFFFVVLLIGAQHQEKEVRSLLPYVNEILYDNMNDGEVCAFDARGNSTLREKVEATQRTFNSKDEAHLAGYSVLHCGACAACSDYNDLRQQYTTREVLGQVALKCAKKVLLGGGFEKLKQCTMEETGFNDDCAACWTQDYICVRQNCIFISIRAFMINTVTNLQVGENDITPATCEEAMCEATEITGYIGFVPCSGASRRRMNIISSITRPGNQQCQIVDVPSWESFFGPSEGRNDYIEDWNATQI